MHDMDRMRQEMERGLDALETTGFEFEEESPYMQEVYGEYGAQETGGFGFANEGVFGEVQEMELAAELLEITSEQELNQFLGKLIKRAGSAIGAAVRSPIGQALGGALKGVAGRLLPVAGAAPGNMIVPGIGGAIGGKLAGAAGEAFGLELEGLSAEDREFEVARRFVRLAGSATQHAASVPPTADPATVARAAISTAARTIAPGLAQLGILNEATQPASVGNGSVGSGLGQSGRWVRRGRRIVLLGV